MRTLEINLNLEAVFEDWEYKHFISYEERINVCKQHRQLAADLPLYKSDFIDDRHYFEYLILKKKQLDERENGSGCA